MVDPDIPNPCYATNEAPLVHMVAVDVPVTPDVVATSWDGVSYASLNFAAGKVLMAYEGPNPPDQAPHGYYFLLYEQETSEIGFSSRDEPGFKDYHAYECLPGSEGR